MLMGPKVSVSRCAVALMRGVPIERSEGEGRSAQEPCCTFKRKNILYYTPTDSCVYNCNLRW
jgi:hypothetical protein